MNDSIMRSDRRGRLRYTPEQKKSMLDACRASGLSAPRFASLHGVSYQTLVFWIRKDQATGSANLPRSLHSAFLSLVPTEIDCSTTSAGHAMEALPPGGA